MLRPPGPQVRARTLPSRSVLPAAGRTLAVNKSTLRLLQANLLVATLAGFWGRKADGHPGPDLMGRGLLILNALVVWERIHTPGRRKKPKRRRRKSDPRTKLTSPAQ
mgnify:CR=1 FL=1